MTATISRLYNNYADARDAVRNLEAAGIAHNDINIIASNADNWYHPIASRAKIRSRIAISTAKMIGPRPPARAPELARRWAVPQVCSPGSG